MRRFRNHTVVLAAILALLLPMCWPQPADAAITLTIYFGKPPDCTGRGFCKITIGWSTAVAETPKGGENARRAVRRPCRAAAQIKENKMYIEMETAIGERAESVPVEQDLALDAATSKGLGFRSVVIKRGDYKIDYSKNRYGSIVVNVETKS